MEEPTAGPRALRQTSLAVWLDSWYRAAPWERSGRIYAAVGLVSVFRLMARVFGERLPEPTGAPMGADEISQIRLRARYHELVNIISVLVQLPLPAMAAHVGSGALFAYSLLLFVPHLLSITLERYKRAVCDAMPESAEPFRPAHRSHPPDPSHRPTRPAFFGPYGCETERAYARLGVVAFRRFVLWLIRVSSVGGGRDGSVRNVVGGRSGLAAFEAQTRTAELTHLFGTTLHVPFLVMFARSGFTVGVAFVIFLFALNLECALLQRLHRVRLRRLMDRASAPCAGATRRAAR